MPTGAPPLDAAGVRERIVAALKDAKVAIHLIGAHYGFVPEGEERSIIELQSDEATYQASTSTAARIVWLAPNVQPRPTPERPDRAGAASHRPQGGRVDVLANQTIEALKTLVLDRLNPATKATPRAEGAAMPVVYLMCDQLDRDDRGADPGLSVRPVAGGHGFRCSRAIRRRFATEHYETLKECDGVLCSGARRKRAGCATCCAT